MKQRLIVSLVFTIPLFYISMGHMAGWPLPPWLLGARNHMIFAFTQFLLVLPVLIAGGHYFKNGLRNLWHRSPNMDSLIALGSGAAFCVWHLCDLQNRLGLFHRRYGYGRDLWHEFVF